MSKYDDRNLVGEWVNGKLVPKEEIDPENELLIQSAAASIIRLEPAYHVTYRLNGKTITFQQPIPDPFIRGRITIGWPDLLRALLRGRLTVETIVGGDLRRINEVLDLDTHERR